MRGLRYQLKSILQDKLVLVSILLPLVMALLIRGLPGGLVTATELQFVVPIDFAEEDMLLLERFGTVTRHGTISAIEQAVQEPATDAIGLVYSHDTKIYTIILAGDEQSRVRASSELLATLLHNKGAESQHIGVNIIASDNLLDALLPALTVLTAMFIGCTFNAMNIAAEKEEGINTIYDVLPITRHQYVLQKALLGFIGSLAVALSTLMLLVETRGLLLPALVLITLASILSSLLGLYIGAFAQNLISSIVYIKTALLVFIAAPFLAYVSSTSTAYRGLLNLMPSYPAFSGIMELMAGNVPGVLKSSLILFAHVSLWYTVYLRARPKRMTA